MSLDFLPEEIKTLQYIRRDRPEVITRTETIDEEEWILVFDDIGKAFYKLTGRAGTIWGLLDGDHTVSDIIEAIQRQAGAPGEDVARDVLQFIRKAGKKGLIKAALRPS